MLREIAPGLHVAEAPQRFAGMQIGTRMTVIELGDGLFVHSPLDAAPERVAHVGEPRWVLAPSLYHHLYAGRWAAAGLDLWGAPGLPKKREDLAFHGVIEGECSPFGSDLVLLPLRCLPITNEVVVLHRPSRTLIVSDLVFNLPPSTPWGTRAMMRCLCGYPGFRATLLERVMMKRPRGREELATIADWDFDRMIMAHGDIVERGGKDALVAAYRWLPMRSRGLLTGG